MSGPFYAMKFPLGVGNTTRHDDIYYEQRKIITNIADRENCIIVGRCADYTLQDHDNILKIYIYAPYEARMRNCVDISKPVHHTTNITPDICREITNIWISQSTAPPLGIDHSAEVIRDIVLKKFGDMM